jgi:hypothetical protein
MKKTFPLQLAGKNPARVLETIKRDVRRYVKRERAKTLPAGATRWEFDCRVGVDDSAAAPVPVPELSRAIDTAAASGAAGVFVEITARPGAGVGPDDQDPEGDKTAS